EASGPNPNISSNSIGVPYCWINASSRQLSSASSSLYQAGLFLGCNAIAGPAARITAIPSNAAILMGWPPRIDQAIIMHPSAPDPRKRSPARHGAIGHAADRRAVVVARLPAIELMHVVVLLALIVSLHRGGIQGRLLMERHPALCVLRRSQLVARL